MGNLLTPTIMFTLFVVLTILLYIASFIGVTVGIENSPKKDDGTVQVTTAGGCLSMLLLVPSFMVLVVLARSWAITILWEWFVTPVFSVASPSQLQAYGLVLFIALFLSFPKVQGSKTKTEFMSTFLNPFLFIGMTLATSWVLHTLM